MWARLVVAPWWVLWLVVAARSAVALVTICLLGVRDFPARTGGIWGLVALVGFTLVVTAVASIARRPVQQSFQPAVAGMTLPERSQAAMALRRGEIPADPRILAAAIRVGNLLTAYESRIPRWQPWFQWSAPILWLLAGILGFVGNDTRGGLTWTGLALLAAALFLRTSYKKRRMSRRLHMLRSAAESSPQALSAVAAAEDSAAPPPRMRVRLALAVLVLVAAVVVAAALLKDRRSAACRTADAAVGYIHANPEMLDARLIGPGDPGLDKYRHWSDQLHSYARQVPTGELAPHLRRIAELSAQAVGMVSEAKKVGGASLSTDELVARDAAYHDIIRQLIDEDADLIPICHRQ